MSIVPFARRISPLLLWLVGIMALTTTPAAVRAAPSATVRPTVSVSVLAADDWSWDAFGKFWKKQCGKTSGVIGVVVLVAIGAVLIILSKGRG